MAFERDYATNVLELFLHIEFKIAKEHI